MALPTPLKRQLPVLKVAAEGGEKAAAGCGSGCGCH
jgi:hypothetical protein